MLGLFKKKNDTEADFSTFMDNEVKEFQESLDQKGILKYNLEKFKEKLSEEDKVSTFFNLSQFDDFFDFVKIFNKPFYLYRNFAEKNKPYFSYITVLDTIDRENPFSIETLDRKYEEIIKYHEDLEKKALNRADRKKAVKKTKEYKNFISSFSQGLTEAITKKAEENIGLMEQAKDSLISLINANINKVPSLASAKILATELTIEDVIENYDALKMFKEDIIFVYNKLDIRDKDKFFNACFILCFIGEVLKSNLEEIDKETITVVMPEFEKSELMDFYQYIANIFLINTVFYSKKINLPDSEVLSEFRNYTEILLGSPTNYNDFILNNIGNFRTKELDDKTFFKDFESDAHVINNEKEVRFVTKENELNYLHSFLKARNYNFKENFHITDFTDIATEILFDYFKNNNKEKEQFLKYVNNDEIVSTEEIINTLELALRDKLYPIQTHIYDNRKDIQKSKYVNQLMEVFLSNGDLKSLEILTSSLKENIMRKHLLNSSSVEKSVTKGLSQLAQVDDSINTNEYFQMLDYFEENYKEVEYWNILNKLIDEIRINKNPSLDKNLAKRYTQSISKFKRKMKDFVKSGYEFNIQNFAIKALDKEMLNTAKEVLSFYHDINGGTNYQVFNFSEIQETRLNFNVEELPFEKFTVFCDYMKLDSINSLNALFVELVYYFENKNLKYFLETLKKHNPNTLKKVINFVNDEGYNALNYAVHSDREELSLEQVKILIEYGINVNFVDEEGDNAYSLAENLDNEVIMKLLLDNGFDKTKATIENKAVNPTEVLNLLKEIHSSGSLNIEEKNLALKIDKLHSQGKFNEFLTTLFNDNAEINGTFQDFWKMQMENNGKHFKDNNIRDINESLFDGLKGA